MRTIKYTGMSDEILVYIDDIKTFIPFKRNQWFEVSDIIANSLLKKDKWIDKEDFIVNLSEFKNPITIGFFRFGALGDLIQLVPIARYIKRQYNHRIILITQHIHVEFMKNFKDVFIEVLPNTGFHKSKVDKLVNLDGVLECDHSLINEEREFHRVFLYERFFNIKCDFYDFSMKIDRNTKSEMKRLLNASI